jgi:hypothetical protein
MGEGQADHIIYSAEKTVYSHHVPHTLSNFLSFFFWFFFSFLPFKLTQQYSFLCGVGLFFGLRETWRNRESP